MLTKYYSVVPIKKHVEGKELNETIKRILPKPVADIHSVLKVLDWLIYMASLKFTNRRR